MRRIRVFATGGRRGWGTGLSALDRSLIGEHWSAIEHFRATGDESRLQAVRQKLIDRSRTGRPELAGVELEFDPDVIEEASVALDDRFESIYDDGEA